MGAEPNKFVPSHVSTKSREDSLAPVPKPLVQKEAPREYSEEIREQVLAEIEATGSISAAARKFNIGYTTVLEWRKKAKSDEYAALRSEKKMEVVNKAWDLAAGLLDNMNESRGMASLRDQSTAFNTLIDKLQILGGAPGGRNETSVGEAAFDISKRIKRMQEFRTTVVEHADGSVTKTVEESTTLPPPAPDEAN